MNKMDSLFKEFEVNRTKVDYANTDQQHRDFIKQMAIGAWNAYCSYAWGHGELDFRPKAKWGWFGPRSGYTLIATMPTLYIFGLMDEFEKAKKWVQSEFNWDKLNVWVDVSRMVTDYIGAFLSCYALTGDWMFVDKAKILAVALAPAYSGKDGDYILNKTFY